MGRWAFGEFVLDLDTRALLRAGTPVALSPKAIQLLGLLIECRPRALSKSELQDRIWPGTFVVEKNLPNLVGEIRGALGEDAARPRFIRTVPRFGYAFCEAPAARSHNLPEPVTSFIGREREIVELARLLPSVRLMTLTGAGGSGKTRLALEVARKATDGFSDGVWLADLSSLSDPALVTQKVASVLDVRQAPGRSLIETLSDQLRNRRVLLLLDNCEHLIGACADLAGALLPTATGLTILATSREALGIPGEATWRVPSLSLAEANQVTRVDDLSQCESIRLLVERAGAVDSDFALTPANAGTVAEVCRRLDGIPLAIELAAARLNVLSIEQINARLDDRIRLLAAPYRTPIARHRTMEAAIAWSYNLLPDTECELLQRLSTFAGGWTLQAAEDVCAGDGIDREDVLDLMSRLIDKSLVTFDKHATGPRRYRYLETVRQYTRDRLNDSGKADAVRDRHFTYYLELARRAEPELTTARQLHWLDLLEVEHDNLRAALEWSLGLERRDDDGLALAANLHWFWLKRSHFVEGRHWLERALASRGAPEASVRAQLLMALGSITFFQGHFEHAHGVLEQSVALARTAGELSTVAIALGVRTLAALELGDFASAARLAAEAGAAARAAGAPWLESFSLSFLAHEAFQAGDVDRAVHLHEEVLARLRAHGELWSTGIALLDLALLRIVQQRHSEARALCGEAIVLGRQFGDWRSIAWCLGVLSGADAAEGNPTRAARLRGAMEGLLDSIGAPVQPTYTAWIGDRYFGAVEQALGKRDYQQAMAEGRAMSPSQAIEYAEAG